MSNLIKVFKELLEGIEDDIESMKERIFQTTLIDDEDADENIEKENNRLSLVKPFKYSLKRLNKFKYDYPKLEIKDTGEKYLIVGEVPGITKDDLDIYLDADNKIITISYKKKEEYKDEKSETQQFIKKYKEFTERFYLRDLDTEKISEIKSKLENGILTIEIPQKTENKIKIEIE